MSAKAKFLTVVDTFTGYCQVCLEPRLVGRIAVAGWQHHGMICGQCLRELADEVQRRGEGLAADASGNGDTLAAIVRGNGQGGNGHIRRS